MGIAERYKFFLNLNIPKGPHTGGSKRPKFLFPLFNLKARTWALQKGTSSFKTLIYWKARTWVGLKDPTFVLPLFNFKIRTWALQKGTSSFKSSIYRKARTWVVLKGPIFWKNTIHYIKGGVFLVLKKGVSEEKWSSIFSRSQNFF